MQLDIVEDLPPSLEYVYSEPLPLISNQEFTLMNRYITLSSGMYLR